MSAPWLAMSSAWALQMASPTLSRQLGGGGLAVGDDGHGPSVTTASAMSGRSRGMPATAKPVAVGGMGVHHRAHVGPAAVDRGVHQDLGGGAAAALGPALEVGAHDHVRGQEALAHAGGGHESASPGARRRCPRCRR